MAKFVHVVLVLFLVLALYVAHFIHSNWYMISQYIKYYPSLYKTHGLLQMEQFTKAYVTPSYTQKIPFMMFQTGPYPVSLDVNQVSMTNRHLNPEYEYRYYNDNTDRVDYIKQYEPSLLGTYENLLPGAYRADLFRLLVLYYEGGVYMDDKTTCILPVRKFIKQDKEYVAFRDVAPGACFNGFLAVVPRHSLIRDAIDRIKQNVATKNYGINALDPTGPQLLGRSLNAYLQRSELEPFDEKEYGEQREIDLIGTFRIYNDAYQCLMGKDGTPLVQKCYNGYYNISRILSKKNYITQWANQKGVFKKLH